MLPRSLACSGGLAGRARRSSQLAALALPAPGSAALRGPSRPATAVLRSPRIPLAGDGRACGRLARAALGGGGGGSPEPRAAGEERSPPERPTAEADPMPGSLDFLSRELSSTEPSSVTVTLLSGANVTFAFTSTMTVRDLKLMIKERTGLEAEAQRLLLRSNMMQDADTIASLRPQQQERVILITRLRGG